MVKYIENYALYQEIGSGVYGKVFRAINNTDKKEYAIKVIPISKFRQNKKLQECTVNQINILTNMEVHKHIIRYYDMLKTSNNFYFIYQYCNGGTLDALIAKQGKLPENKVLMIFKQLLEAFQVLNKYNIMHRDMKPDNIFFHNGVIKLGDFGFCKNLNSADEMTKTMLGSPIYMAPEVLKGQIYSNKADIWSLGVVLYEMVYGHCPFQSNSIAKLIQVLNTKQLQFPGEISPYLKNIISKMLTKDSVQRISWMQLFQIKINAQGLIQSPQYHKINSLEEAKTSNEANQIISSSKNIIKENQRQSSREQFPNTNGKNGNGNFKKNKSPPPFINNINVSNTALSNGSYNTNATVLNGNYSNNSSVGIVSNNVSNNVNNNVSNVSNNSVGITQNQTMNDIGNQWKNLGKDHSNALDGVRLAMQIVQSKIPNNMGYGYLILTRVIKILTELVPKYSNPQVRNILEGEIRDVKAEVENITGKMFTYELKGIEEWKKYLRGKFFEEEKTIHIWYKLINFLNGTITNSSNLNYKAMVENIKNVLY